MSKKAVLYARVSTDDQADKGYSLPSQLEFCRKCAEGLGFEVIAEMREDYSGATPIAERTEGKKLLDLFKRHEADALIAYRVDRLSRDIVDLLVNVQRWLHSNIEIHFCDIGRVENENNIMLVINGWKGTDERQVIRERLTRGTMHKVKSGKVIGGGRAPYGFAFERDNKGKVVSFTILEAEARIVRMIYLWYTKGDNGLRLSAFQITRKLSEMRIQTPGETRKYKRKRESGLWTSCQVLKILSDETYAGVWRYGRMIGKSGKRGMRPVDEQIKVRVPAIIDRETWEKAQAQRAYNKQMSKRNGKRFYLLRGMIRCGCNLSMVGKFMGTQRYYICNWRANHIKGLEERPCNEKDVNADAIEKEVWEYIEGLFADLEKFKQELLQAQAEENDFLAPKREELEAVEKLIANCDVDAAECAAALRKAKGRVKESLEIQQDEINARYDALAKRRDELQTELGARRLTDASVQAALRFREDALVGMKAPTQQDKRSQLETLRVQVEIKDGKARITCIIPGHVKEVAIVPHTQIRTKLLLTKTGALRRMLPTGGC